eukprot:864086-Prorocentrum_lima.AAC.1
MAQAQGRGAGCGGHRNTDGADIPVDIRVVSVITSSECPAHYWPSSHFCHPRPQRAPVSAMLFHQ